MIRRTSPPYNHFQPQYIDMKHIEQIMLVIFIVAIFYLYYKKPLGLDSVQTTDQVQASAPWFLLYNYPVGFIGNTTLEALPSRSVGQMNASGFTHCDTCSLIPVSTTSQY